jgi:outer membrane protein OmpU
MNNLKKIGLTALAASLVTTSAFAGALSVSGGASLSLKNMTGAKDPGTGKSFSMGNDVTFSGSGELDNGLNVAVSFTLDQGDDQSAGTNVASATSPFDGHSVTISSDALGTFKFSGEGGSSAQGAIDGGAAGDIWNTGTGISEITGAAAGDNSMFYTLPTLMDGVAITASMSPGSGATQDTHTSYALAYTGVEGLTLKYGQGDSGASGSETTSTTMHASYAIGSFTLAVANTEADNEGAVNREVDSMQIAYTVSDDMSVTYGTETFEKEGETVDEEVAKLGVSYTTGGMTIGAATIESKGAGNTAGLTSNRWQLDLSFAF